MGTTRSGMNDDEIVFYPEGYQLRALNSNKEFKVLVVDDEQDVFEITQKLLENYKFLDGKITVEYASSGEEAIEYMKTADDVCLILLDVVMERDTAGLEVIDFVRKDKKDFFTQIIIRTAYSVKVKTDNVVLDYEIQGYMEKDKIRYRDLIYSTICAIRTNVRMKTMAASN